MGVISIVNGIYKPTNITGGAPPCMEKSPTGGPFWSASHFQFDFRWIYETNKKSEVSWGRGVPPKAGCSFWGNIRRKWMIWGYSYFRNPPYEYHQVRVGLSSQPHPLTSDMPDQESSKSSHFTTKTYLLGEPHPILQFSLLHTWVMALQNPVVYHHLSHSKNNLELSNEKILLVVFRSCLSIYFHIKCLV